MSNLELRATPATLPTPLLAGTFVLALAMGAVVAALNASPIVALAAVAIALVVLIAASPFLGACVWLVAGPLVVGIARGEAIPFARPNELLLLIAVVGVALNSWWRVSKGERVLPKLNAVDAGVAALFVTGMILPLLVLYLRGIESTEDDLLYPLVFAKYFVLYFMFRIAVRTEAEVATSLRLILASAVIVAVVAILQVNSLFGVPQLLFSLYDAPFEGAEGPISLRGTSTIASAFGLADMMAMCIAIVIAWLPRHKEARPFLLAAGLIFLGGIVAAGSFSGIIGCVVAVLVAAFVTGQLRTYLALLFPAGLLASAAFWPVISARLSGFDNINALPQSWVGRWENLERFFWPELLSGTNWLWGVRPAARVPAPETWRDWVYIESGHTWLMWSGGLPLLVAYFVFTWIVLRQLFGIVRERLGAISVAASAAFTTTVVIFVLMLFDPHLTVRGSADLFFPLLALALVRPAARTERAAAPADYPAP